MSPSQQVLIIELSYEDGEWLTAAPREPQFEITIASRLYVLQGNTAAPCGDVTANAVGWVDFRTKIAGRLAAAHPSVRVISPHAMSVLERMDNIAAVLAGTTRLLPRTLDPIQELNSPAIMSLDDRLTCTRKVFDGLAPLQAVHADSRYFYQRDLLYLELLRRQGYGT